MKVGDLVRHKNPKLNEHQGAHIVTFVGPTAIQILGHTGFHPPADWEVINENR